ncbi:MAG TPA: fibronectin type III domain-containing protein [Candidatus Dormibacteraeota bacterium]|nr:fibronectin type III domain-containing protein [Candidatus Dormibacteraeota bacterium]
MKLLLGQLLVAVTLLIGLAGCASIGPPLPPALELPKAPSDLRAVRKGEKVTLTWTIPARTTDRQMVRYLGKTRVCRSMDVALATCGDAVGQVAPPADFAGEKNAGGKKLAATYTDNLPADMRIRSLLGSATYAVEVLNRDGRGAGLSNEVHVPLAVALPPPTDFSARVTAQGVVLSWTGVLLSLPIPNPVRRSYRVYRRAEGSGQKILVGERDAGLENQLSLTDQNFEWEKTYYYHGDTLTVISQAGKPDVLVEGDDTPEVKVFAHDVFPPAVPSGVQAVFSGPGQEAFIDLIWAPVTDADLDGYNVYRREEGGVAVKVNDGPVKTPGFRDQHVVSGKTYFYSVSAVDVRGNESGKSEEAGEKVP